MFHKSLKSRIKSTNVAGTPVNVSWSTSVSQNSKTVSYISYILFRNGSIGICSCCPASLRNKVRINKSKLCFRFICSVRILQPGRQLRYLYAILRFLRFSIWLEAIKASSWYFPAFLQSRSRLSLFDDGWLISDHEKLTSCRARGYHTNLP